MNPYKLIKTATTVAELRAIKIQIIDAATALQDDIRAGEQTIKAAERQLERDKAKLEQVGSIPRLRAALKEQLAELRIGELDA